MARLGKLRRVEQIDRLGSQNERPFPAQRPATRQTRVDVPDAVFAERVAAQVPGSLGGFDIGKGGCGQPLTRGIRVIDRAAEYGRVDQVRAVPGGSVYVSEAGSIGS